MECCLGDHVATSSMPMENGGYVKQVVQCRLQKQELGKDQDMLYCKFYGDNMIHKLCPYYKWFSIGFCQPIWKQH